METDKTVLKIPHKAFMLQMKDLFLFYKYNYFQAPSTKNEVLFEDVRNAENYY